MTTQQTAIAAETERRHLNVLVSGASFAGLATAFWMNQLGYTVTVVGIVLSTGLASL